VVGVLDVLEQSPEDRDTDVCGGKDNVPKEPAGSRLVEKKQEQLQSRCGLADTMSQLRGLAGVYQLAPSSRG